MRFFTARRSATAHCMLYPSGRLHSLYVYCIETAELVQPVFHTGYTFDLPTLCYKGIRGISKITVGLYFPVQPYRKVRI